MDERRATEYKKDFRKMKTKDIIFAHGFGVRADARGMFTDIADALSDANCITFDFNTFDSEGNTTVTPLNEQVKILQSHIDQAQEGATLICHSQGCIVASLANLDKIGQVIFLAPPPLISIERFISKFGKREGSVLNLDGISSIPRSDGSTTYIPKDYIDSIKSIDVPSLYKKLAQDHKLTIIRATKDNILGETNFDYFENVEMIDIAADHDFTGDARNKLVGSVKKMI